MRFGRGRLRLQAVAGIRCYASFVERQKIRNESLVLGRPFHADAFVAGPKPTFLMLFFGGSGVSESVYLERLNTIVPIFDRTLESLERTHSFGFVYVTAPFDVPFLRFPVDPAAADRWNTHVRIELLSAVFESLPAMRGLPRYTAGYSGGAPLALAGHHSDAECFGAGLLGADGLDQAVAVPASWPEPITLYYNRNDNVFHSNVATIRALENGRRAACYRQLPGGHALEDYVQNESFGGLIRRAARTLSAA